MRFYVGLHHPADAGYFSRVCLSANVLRTRRKPIGAGEWLLDSGAFTELSTYGHYRTDVATYAALIQRLATANPGLCGAVTQDYMCEPWILAKTGGTVASHQAATVARYDALVSLVPAVPILPVLQGYLPQEYLRHLDAYGARLTSGMWVGIGSLCKRNANVCLIEEIVLTLTKARPDLRYHGFGLKLTALRSAIVRDLLWSADSMAWSYAARCQGRSRDANDWREALRFVQRVECAPAQLSIFARR